MARRDAKRVTIRLKSTAGTHTTYTTQKNKVNDRERLELRKYDPRVRQHVIFREER
jgi:large subunit ribosomal protein L33